jgi:hypothetical protein
LAALRCAVKLGHPAHDTQISISVKHPQELDWQRGVQQIKGLGGKLHVKLLPRKASGGRVPVLCEHKKYVLVKHEVHQRGNAQVIQAAVQKEQWLQETESRKRVVTGICSVHAFCPCDAHSNMGSADHVNIISTIPNGQCSATRHTIAHQLDHLSFLVRAAAAAHNGFSGSCEIQKVLRRPCDRGRYLSGP